MARPRHYPFVRFVIGLCYGLAVAGLLAGLGGGGYLWYRAEAMTSGVVVGGPLYELIGTMPPAQLLLVAIGCAVGGLVAFLLFGTVAQMLSMQRDLSRHAAIHTQLLDSILDQSEEAQAAGKPNRVDLCEGCGRLGALHRIDSGQWVCRECRRQLRTA